jgi:hypothetical protein
MQIAQLGKSGSVAEIARRVYGLAQEDPGLTQAENALAAANPHLARDLAALPPNTPVVVPDLPGLSVTNTDPINPIRAALMNVLNNLEKTAEQASNTQLSGSTNTAAPEPNLERARALEALRNDITSFLKTHSR